MGYSGFGKMMMVRASILMSTGTLLFLFPAHFVQIVDDNGVGAYKTSGNIRTPP